MMPEIQGRFVWYELMTTDKDAAEAFYKAVVGWDAQDFGQAGMSYTILTAGERRVAGMMPIPAEACETGARPGWSGYIGVGDVDAAAARLAKAGGAVHREPADIPEVGRFAVVADPQGAAFMLFTPSGEGEPSAPAGTPGHVGWHELRTTDWGSALAFYSNQFGWTKADAVDMGPMGTYQLFAADGDAIGGMMNDSDGGASPAWLFYFCVDEIDAATDRISANRGQVLRGPHQVPGGAWVVHAQDPQGAAFALVGPRR